MKKLLISIAVAVICTASANAETDIHLLPPVDAATTETKIPVGEDLIVENTGPIWYSPSTWFGSLWENSIELGINGSEGNADSFSILTGGKMKRESDATKFLADLTYGRTKAGGVETQNYALGNSRWDWKMNEQWFFYNKNTIEFDRFKPFDMRLSLTGGLGYDVIETDSTTLTTRLGAGASREFGGPADEWVPEANLGLDFERKINEVQKISGVMDYFPSWEDFGDYRLVTKVDWELLLRKDGNLSLKIGAIDRYDSTPNGNQANDLDYYATLLWKL
ncbi:MAG: DUF481 domain-containing protein [Planctomycetales bacterium]|nr:DUF481 domain-containing protein [Planctomycetales bacterium]